LKRKIYIWSSIIALIVSLFLVVKKVNMVSTGNNGNIIIVHNGKQLVDALRPNVTIRLAPGNYDLNKVKEKLPYFQNRSITNIHNLTIEGKGEKHVDFITADLYAPVIKFKNCENVIIRNLNIGHVPAQDGCQGNVVEIAESKNITIDKCIMFGCGINGLALYQVQDFNCKNSFIKECSQSILVLGASKGIIFENCNFMDNEGNEIRTGNCDKVEFKNCAIIGKESVPLFSDSDHYSALSNEGTIFGEYSGYSSVYVAQFKDWISNVILQNVWISTKDYYECHRKTDGFLRKIFEKNLISTNMTRNSLNIKLTIAKDELKITTVCNHISKLAQSKELFKDKRVQEVTFKFFTDDLNVLTLTATQGNLIKYLSENNPRSLEKYCKLTIDSPDVQLKTFWEDNNSYLSGKEAIEKVAELIEIKAEIEDEHYINGPEFQRFSYYGAIKEKEQLFHFIKLEQKLPLLGDYIHYITFVKLKINALSGEVYIEEPSIGESRVYKIQKGLKEYIISSVSDKEFENEGVKLGRVEADKSLFILLKDEPDAKLVKVQLFTEEGGKYYVLFSLKKQESGWEIVNQQVSEINVNGF
jgi:hypothetical protein